MNTLNLNAYGVSEMNKQEMIETDGGFAFLLLALLPYHVQIKQEGGKVVSDFIGCK